MPATDMVLRQLSRAHTTQLSGSTQSSTGHSLSHSLNCAALAHPTSTSPPDASPPPGRLNAPCPTPKHTYINK